VTTEGPIQVAASADDASEKNGASFTSAGIEIAIVSTTSASSRGDGGFRFNAVNVPTGATVDDVDFELYNINFGGFLEAHITANLVADAADFSTDPDVTTRIASAATVATILWAHDFSSTGFIASSTDDFLDMNAIIQEIIDQPAPWVDGNDLVMLAQGGSTEGRRGPKSFVVRSYDGNTSQAARLTVDYTGGGGGPAVNASLRLLRGAGR
jgi:hypothetical protein